MKPLTLRPDLQPKRKRAYPEDALAVEVCAAMKYLLGPNVIWASVPNGGKRNVREAGRLKAMGLLAGFADYIVLWSAPDGLRIGLVELKATKGRQSAEQIAFERKAAAIGIPYAIARSLDEVIDTLQGWGTPMRGSIGMRNKSP